MRMDDERIFGITKLKLQAFSLAALEIILGDIVVKVSSMMERLGKKVMINLLEREERLDMMERLGPMPSRASKRSW